MAASTFAARAPARPSGDLRARAASTSARIKARRPPGCSASTLACNARCARPRPALVRIRRVSSGALAPPASAAWPSSTRLPIAAASLGGSQLVSCSTIIQPLVGVPTPARPAPRAGRGPRSRAVRRSAPGAPHRSPIRLPARKASSTSGVDVLEVDVRDPLAVLLGAWPRDRRRRQGVSDVETQAHRVRAIVTWQSRSTSAGVSTYVARVVMEGEPVRRRVRLRRRGRRAARPARRQPASVRPGARSPLGRPVIASRSSLRSSATTSTSPLRGVQLGQARTGDLQGRRGSGRRRPHGMRGVDLSQPQFARRELGRQLRAAGEARARAGFREYPGAAISSRTVRGWNRRGEVRQVRVVPDDGNDAD